MIFTRLRRAFSCGFSHPSGSRHLLLLERLPASLSRPREDSGIERNCQIGDRLRVGASSDRPRAVYNPLPRIITLGLVAPCRRGLPKIGVSKNPITRRLAAVPSL